MKIKNNYKVALYISAFTCVVSGSLLVESCNQKPGQQAYTLTGNVLVDGKHLVEENCTKCHALVPADALTKNVWKYHIMPSMARYFHVSSYMEGYYKSEKDTGGLTLTAYQTMADYYQKLAPDTLLPAKKPEPLLSDWAGFTLKKPEEAKEPSFTTMAAVDTFNQKIYTSDEKSSSLTVWNAGLKPQETAILPSAAVAALFDKGTTGNNEALFTCIGEIQRMDFPNGRVVRMNLDAKDKSQAQTDVATDLNRAVQTIQADFNNDGRKDLVVLGQGHYKGGVYLFKQNADHSYSQSDISDQTGAVQAVAGDFNKDGWQDLMVLFGSGDEGLWLFTNNHNGGFTPRNLLRFPPVYGSTSFQLVDFDHDGNPDLIYTAGYNYGNSRILKPYHGLYIFRNTGNWNFKQQWFYPINGCTKAIAADFDGDGDMDIATSAFFADLKDNPAESFIYFEQVGPFKFKPHAVPVSKYGRWMSMSVGDYNHDGRPDIILGNYSNGFFFQWSVKKPFWNQKLPFIVLENNIHRK